MSMKPSKTFKKFFSEFIYFLSGILPFHLSKWFKFRKAFYFLFKPQNRIVCSTLPRSTKNDVPELMTEAIFQLIINFVEKERLEIIDWEANEEQRKIKNTIDELYAFAKEERFVLEAQKNKHYDHWHAKKAALIESKMKTTNKNQLERFLNSSNEETKELFKKALEFENDFNKLIHENLIRAIGIKDYLWV